MMSIRIREGNALVVGKVWTIVLTHATLNRSRHFRDDICRTFIRAAHMALTRSTSFTRHALDALRDGLERVLQRVILVGVGAGA